MARRLGWLLVVSLIVPAVAHAQSVDTLTLRNAIAQAGGRVIIGLKSGRAASLRQGAAAMPARQLDAIEERITGQYPLSVHGRAAIASALFATISDTDVVRVLADSNVDVLVPDGLGVPGDAVASSVKVRSEITPWGITAVGAPAAWAAGLTGSGVKVGIMDGGIDYTHPDLNVVGGYDFTTGSSAASAYNDNVASCGGHGTHVAGTVGAKQNGVGVIGVAPAVSLYALKVFQDIGGSCLAWESDQIAALNWAAANGVRVVNISIGNSGYNQVYQNAVTNAIAAGVTIVASAGNGSGGPIVFPGAYVGVIAVGALDQGNTPAYYESVGLQMWIAAPGTNILSTLPGGGTGTKSGTSMAAPHVVGVAALLLQSQPSWTPLQVQTAIKAGAIDIGAPGFDNLTGWGLAQAPTGGSGTIPVVVSVSPAGRSVSVAQGSVAPGDNAVVTLAGTNAATTAWTVSRKKSWTTLITPSGTGSGSLAWTRSTSGLAVGTYIDTLTVVAAGITPAVLFDTLKITSAIVSVTVAVTPAARSVSAPQGTPVAGDNATVTLAGTNAWSTAWRVTKQKSWTTLTTTSGTGNGSIAWARNTAGLAVGTYVDTLMVTALGVTPAVLYDTLKITAVPVVLSVSPAARSVSVAQGSVAPGDNAVVTLAGTNAATTAWTVTRKKSWTTLTTTSGTGNGSIAWARNTTGLAVGTYVDTLTVTALGIAPAVLFDTLKITSAIVSVTVAVTPAARSVSVAQGSVAPGDNATVTLSGTVAWSTAWTVSKRGSWTTLATASGTGNGSIAWARNTTGLAVGTYVDTLTVTALGIAPAVLVDTVRITPTAVSLAVSPTGRSVSAPQGTPVAGDNATVTLTGAAASTTVWTATNVKSWTTLTAASDTGSGILTWTRSTAGLAVGMYIDTLTITVIGAIPAILYDTVTITMPPVAAAFVPVARSTSVPQGSAAPGANAAVSLVGTNAWSAQWTVSKKKPWTTLTASGGTANGSIAWTRNTAGLAVGTYVDTFTVAGAGIAPALMFDTLKIVPASAAMAGLRAAETGVRRTVILAAGLQSATPRDSTAIVSDAANVADSSQWYGSTNTPRISLIVAEGVLSTSKVTWTRAVEGLAAGQYIDSIFVALVATPEVRTVIVDTLDVITVVLPAPDVAAQELFTPGRLTAEQRNALDQIGNRNGHYDLGDFLAWVERANIHLSTALRRQLLSLPTPRPSSGGPLGTAMPATSLPDH